MRRAAMAMAVVVVTGLACSGAIPTAEPVPPEHKDLIGDWTAPNYTLSIEANGHVAYEYESGGTTSSVNGPVTKWSDTEFSVMGLSTFHIEEAPHREDGQWETTIDGVDYVRPAKGGGKPDRERSKSGKGKRGKNKKR